MFDIYSSRRQSEMVLKDLKGKSKPPFSHFTQFFRLSTSSKNYTWRLHTAIIQVGLRFHQQIPKRNERVNTFIYKFKHQSIDSFKNLCWNHFKWFGAHCGVMAWGTPRGHSGLSRKEANKFQTHGFNQFWIRCPTRHAKTCRRLARVFTQTRPEVAAASEPQVVTGHHLPGTGHLGTVKVCPLTTISTITTFSFTVSTKFHKKTTLCSAGISIPTKFEYIFQNHNYSDLVEVQRSVCEAKNTGGTLTLSQAGLR